MSGESNANPNLGRRATLDTLADEFKFNESFAAKVNELQGQGYTDWRPIRGDGNCYYRSVGFGWLEEILKAPKELRTAWAKALLGKLQTLRFDQASEQKALERLVAHVGRLAGGAGWQEGMGQSKVRELEVLEASFMDTALDLALVGALRILIGNYLLANADDCAVFNGISLRVLCSAQGQGSPDDFCKRTVFAMGVEAETQIMRATVQALEMNLHIVLLDRSEGTRLCYENYNAMGQEGVQLPLVHVQHRPGHYDLIYRNVPSQPDMGQCQQSSQPDIIECQRFFCGDCGTPLLWSQNDKVKVRCQKCGNHFCVLCLAEASRKRSWLEIAGEFVAKRKQSAELICTHVAAQLDEQDNELSSLKAQQETERVCRQKDSEQWLGAVTELEEQFQAQLQETENANARISQVETQHQGLKQTLQDERIQAARDVEKWQMQTQQLQEQLKSAAAEHDELETRHQGLEQTLQDERTKAARDVEQWQMQTQQLQEQLKSAAADHVELQTQHQGLEQTLQDERTRAARDVEKWQMQTQQLQEQLKSAAAEHDELQTQHQGMEQTLQDERTKAARDVEQWQVQAQQLQEQLKSAAADHVELETRHQGLEQTLQDERTKAARDVEQWQMQTQQLQEQLKYAAADHVELQTQHQGMEQTLQDERAKAAEVVEQWQMQTQRLQEKLTFATAERSKVLRATRKLVAKCQNRKSKVLKDIEVVKRQRKRAADESVEVLRQRSLLKAEAEDLEKKQTSLRRYVAALKSAKLHKKLPLLEDCAFPESDSSDDESPRDIKMPAQTKPKATAKPSSTLSQPRTGRKEVMSSNPPPAKKRAGKAQPAPATTIKSTTKRGRHT